MKRSLIHIILLALCLRAGDLMAQARVSRHSAKPAVPAPALKATVDKDNILIGEPVHLMLEATVDGSYPLAWPAPDSLPHFEWIERHPADSTVSGPERSYRQYLTITSFDSGTWAIPRLPFVIGGTTFYTDSIPIRVGYTPIDPSRDYHDIKDIIEVPNPFARWFGWIVGIVALGSVALVVWLVRKRKVLQQLVRSVTAPRLSPYENAIRQLDELEKQRLPETGAFKLFYSRLGEILRRYMYRRLGISSLSETSEELIGQLRQRPLPAQQQAELADALRMGDFVKFAKYQPGLGDCELHYRTIREAIDALNRAVEAEEALARSLTTQNETK
ncbi:MAG TPA: hypothetical protein VN616_11020 [Puia sp.]|nr:hypothetical protein [Puia sp.]